MIRNHEEDEFVAVRVQDPRIQNEGSWNSYVDYKIFLHTNSKAFTAKTSCVRRRYSEFAWLKKKLQKNAGLVPVPELPGRSFFSFSNEDFLEGRRKGLQAFLDRVVHMTVCLSDSQLHLFLQTQLPVGHIQDCVQGLTPYTVTDAILTYASSNRGRAQAQEEEPPKEPSLTISYESMESPAPHQPSLQTRSEPDPLEEVLRLSQDQDQDQDPDLDQHQDQDQDPDLDQDQDQDQDQESSTKAPGDYCLPSPSPPGPGAPGLTHASVLVHSPVGGADGLATLIPDEDPEEKHPDPEPEKCEDPGNISVSGDDDVGEEEGPGSGFREEAVGSVTVEICNGPAMAASATVGGVQEELAVPGAAWGGAKGESDEDSLASSNGSIVKCSEEESLSNGEGGDGEELGGDGEELEVNGEELEGDGEELEVVGEELEVDGEELEVVGVETAWPEGDGQELEGNGEELNGLGGENGDNGDSTEAEGDLTESGDFRILETIQETGTASGKLTEQDAAPSPFPNGEEETS
ncbi:sorting nexin-11 isoform 2-T2 [Menidia menidia]